MSKHPIDARQATPRIRNNDDSAYVYFVQPEQGGMVKIGTTRRLAKRLTLIQAVCPVRLRLLGVIVTGRDAACLEEMRVHVSFAQLREYGEWFRAEPELLAFIASNTERAHFEGSDLLPVPRKVSGQRRGELLSRLKGTIPTLEQVQAILEAAYAARLRDGLLFETIYLYGLRLSELVRLKRDDCRTGAGQDGRIRITRNKRSRSAEYPIFPQLRPKLDAYLAGRKDHCPALFVGRQGALGIRVVQCLFDRYALAAGVMLKDRQGVQALRNSIAVQMFDDGRNIHDVQAHLGHATIQSTQPYPCLRPRATRPID